MRGQVPASSRKLRLSVVPIEPRLEDGSLNIGRALPTAKRFGIGLARASSTALSGASELMELWQFLTLAAGAIVVVCVVARVVVQGAHSTSRFVSGASTNKGKRRSSNDQ